MRLFGAEVVAAATLFILVSGCSGNETTPSEGGVTDAGNLASDVTFGETSADSSVTVDGAENPSDSVVAVDGVVAVDAADGGPEVTADVPIDIPPDLGPQCVLDEDCDSEFLRVCERPLCQDGKCRLYFAPDGTGCSSGDMCKLQQTCTNGECRGGVPPSCDDGNPCTEDSCGPSTGCAHEPIPDCCVPICAGKECGDDGCGGQCGECPSGSPCLETGICGICQKDCAGKACGSDGCGGLCGTCGFGKRCGETFGCEACNCDGRECGDDGCGNSCGECFEGAECNEFYSCGPCEADCTDKLCGSDGCGGSCGECGEGLGCTAAFICAPCMPNCGAAVCGGDGCGGSCGSCDDPLAVCEAGQCIVPGAGDSCALPFTVTQLPFTFEANTANAEPDFGVTSGQCQAGDSGSYGGGSRDHVYEFTPTDSGNFTVRLDSTFDAALYIGRTCEDIGSDCLYAIDDGLSNDIETFSLFLSSEETYYIIVDGWSSSSDLNGAYTLMVEVQDFGGCTPNCTDKECGNNGCGGQCGICSVEGEICGPTGTCGPLGPGDSCDEPFALSADSLPIVADGNTSFFENAMSYGSGACPSDTGGGGGAGKDNVYTFTPTLSTNYKIVLDADFDASLYVVSDCTDVNASCLDGVDFPEELTLFLDAGTTYYIVVDGWSDFSDNSGPYTLTVGLNNPDCVQQCDGAVCGDDGCGGLCGQCGPGTGCANGACADTSVGDSCASPFTASGDLPIVVSGNTSIYTNQMSYGSGACPSDSGGGGAAGKDHVYSFVAPEATNYFIELDAAFDASLYVVRDCEDVNATCLDGVDFPEELVLFLLAGESYTIVVDGWSDFSDNSGTYTLTIDKHQPVDCTADCAGKTCGPNGCGGLCGLCSGEDVCYPDGTCQPLGGGQTCSEPFTLEGALPVQASSDTSLTPQSAFSYGSGACPSDSGGGGAAGKDHVYSFVPPADGNYHIDLDASFDAALYVASDCLDINGTCLDGVDSPEELTLYLLGGQTYFIFVDGWSDSTDYSGAYTLTVDVNNPTCTQQCDGIECGADSCGGLCGICGPGTGCASGICVDTALGDTCEMAFEVSTFPFVATGSTTLAAADYGFTSCDGTIGAKGAASRDHVYSATVPEDGDYVAELSSNFDAVLYVTTDCADIDAGCIGSSDTAITTGTEVVTGALIAGTKIFVIVDGYSTSSDLHGDYTLTIKKCGCDGVDCGSDGCGNNCGACPDGSVCDATNMCIDASAGDTCGTAWVIDAIPFLSPQQNTALAFNDYGYSTGVCPGETGGHGGSAKDHVFSLTAATGGDYRITLQNDYDSTLYVVTDCSDIDNTCLAGAEEYTSSTDEEVLVTLTQGQTVFIIVDGWSTAQGTYQLAVALEGGCVPACGAAVCGDDSCGGTCGDCADGHACEAGVCVDPNAGDLCSAAFEIGALPFDAAGDTTSAANDYAFSAGVCEPEAFAQGADGNDQAWHFVAPSDGEYTFTVAPMGFDAVVYLTSDCADIDSSCLAGDDAGVSGAVEAVTETMTAGQQAWLVVDGWDGAAVGAYDISVSGVFPVVLTGADTCGEAESATPLPFSALANSTGLSDDYATAAAGCGALAESVGAGAPDQTFRRSPAVDGTYAITVTPTGFAAAVYVVTDCSAVDTACVASAKGAAAGDAVILNAVLSASSSYFVIVDGAESAGGAYTLDITPPTN